jgi:hypothetical protein
MIVIYTPEQTNARAQDHMHHNLSAQHGSTDAGCIL